MLESFEEVHLYDPVAVNSSVIRPAICSKNKQTQLSSPPGCHSSITRCSSNSTVDAIVNTQDMNG